MHYFHTQTAILIERNQMKKQRRYITSLLFSTPSFLLGASSIFNLAGNFYKFNWLKSSSETDRRSLNNDFNAIGQDIADTINQFKIQHNIN